MILEQFIWLSAPSVTSRSIKLSKYNSSLWSLDRKPWVSRNDPSDLCDIFSGMVIIGTPNYVYSSKQALLGCLRQIWT